MTWIDGIALLTFGVAFYCGWRAGLIAEFFDLGSLAVGLVVAFWLWSLLAGGLPPTWPLSDAERRLMAFWLVFLFVYAGMRVIGWVVDKRRHVFRDLPAAKWIGGIGGGLIAIAKILVTFFVILYLVLFLPIDRQLRETLRQSPIAIRLDALFPPINDAFINLTPRLVRTVVRPIMNAHRL
jgi:hypothetical protein